MEILTNPHRPHGISTAALDMIQRPSDDSSKPLALLARCPHANTTPLVDAKEMAAKAGVAALNIKDERQRMGLGSFKALGAAYVIACDAEAGQAKGKTYVTASAGNHGLSVAAGASAFGAEAVIFLAETVPETFAARLRDIGAKVRRAGEDYEASMVAAQQWADSHDAILLSDSSWAGYVDRPWTLMQGYLALMQETIDQINVPPSHIMLQAGVGGLAGAAAALARKVWGNGPKIIVVEPEFAPALAASIAAGEPVDTTGPVSDMGRLDCKTPSLIALKGLAMDADFFVTISEVEGQDAAAWAADAGFASTPSGAAGLAPLMANATLRAQLGLDDSARVLVVLSEQADS